MILTLTRTLAAWLTVLASLLAPDPTLSVLSPIASVGVFCWILGVIIWSAFGVVHEAEELAELFGEPLGTLILTLSIVIIEVALIAAVMLSAKGLPTLGRDTMFSVLMIVLNGVVGLGLLVGGLRHHQQSFNLQGASAYLALIIPLSIISLVLPNFTTSSSGGTLSPLQAAFFSLFTLLLYGLFLWLQTGRHRGFFRPEGEERVVENQVSTKSRHSTARHFVMLLANILPIVILAKSLAKLLASGTAALGAPSALGGVIIAMIVFTPEAIAALRAVADNHLTRGINLCLGAALSTLGLTVPAVLLIGLLTNQPVVLGLSSANMVLLAITLVLNMLTFAGPRTTMLEGAVHVSMFAVFTTLIFSP